MNIQVTMSVVANDSARTIWNETLEKREAAKQALEKYNATIYGPLHDELELIAPRPDLSFEIEALNGQIARYHVYPNDLHAWDDHWSPVFQRKAAAVRDAWLNHRQVSERLGTQSAGEESDRLCDVQCTIESSLIDMPAPDHAALLWKLEYLFGSEAYDDDDFSPSWCVKWMNAVMEDARRLLSDREVPGLAAWPTEKIAA